jgi:hypothetical protein
LKRLLYIFITTAFLSIPLRAGVAESCDEYCHIFGAIYFTQTSGEADFNVFVQEDESFADELVYLEENELFADGAGHWYITDVPGFARYKVYLVEEEGHADFSIFYTDSESFVGCDD